MGALVKVLSSEFDSLKRRVIKYMRFGNNAHTSLQVAPHGIDSNPVKGMIAIYADTSGNGDTVIIGYLNKDQLAAVGELRLYSTDNNGVMKTYHWLKNDGTQEIGGNTDFMVRYSKLEQAFNQLKGDFNTHVQHYNAHAHAGVTAGGASTLPTPTTSNPSNADITPAKIQEIKTI